jgi:hypothetical protein
MPVSFPSHCGRLPDPCSRCLDDFVFEAELQPIIALPTVVQAQHPR